MTQDPPRPVKKVAVLLGSLRAHSFSRSLVHALATIVPEPLALDIVEIGDMPFYNPDLEGDDAPAAWKDFRQRILEADALLFVTPEYNRSVPAVLKNAIDVGSRPYGQSVWQGKPGAVISISPGRLGGFGANHHLRQSLMCLNVVTMATPEAYIPDVASCVDEHGAFADTETQAFLLSYLQRFAGWVQLNAGAPASASAP
ncbi:NADPH-dependent FMN reductase [Polaromonas sp. YR568]|uniref:NADPH-dependent FMN reductase n=1 Tax=Polaromonas sp. YR568 TaxID=1855301 RepID=UPI00398C21C2